MCMYMWLRTNFLQIKSDMASYTKEFKLQIW